MEFLKIYILKKFLTSNFMKVKIEMWLNGKTFFRKYIPNWNYYLFDLNIFS